MKTLAGGVVILAGAVLVASGVTANALMASANRNRGGGDLGIVAGVLVGLFGFLVFGLGLAFESADRRPPPARPA